MFLVLIYGAFFQQHVIPHPVGDGFTTHKHSAPLKAGCATQLGYGLCQPVQVAHFISGGCLNLTSHLTFTHGVGMVQILNDDAMLILKVFVQQSNDFIFVHWPLLNTILSAALAGIQRGMFLANKPGCRVFEEFVIVKQD
ncbi:hypothetical protein ES703_01377 [subsurface metagenome]